MAPNRGILEATIALHYVFNSPVDKFVFDVSHQCYPHKILTGRKDGFIDEKDYLKYTGYTAPEESVHDMFKVGHTSTSISLATGLAKARDLKGETGNVIALVGGVG
jgi:1-deoxy-D-xylulose-5-phosphate synthase